MDGAARAPETAPSAKLGVGRRDSGHQNLSQSVLDFLR
jgi:hypothetical protein